MIRTLSLLLVVVPVALMGCDKDRDNAVDTTHITGATTAAPTPNDTPARNAEDQSGALNPIGQGTDSEDLETTQQIRKALIADQTLSTSAKDVKIITSSGTVTLRGPVRSEAERAEIELLAHETAGNDRVVNELEIAGN
jgi:hyperosmotically inducible periplasmic protein